MKGEKKIKKIKNWDPCPHPHQCLLGSLWSRLNRTKISLLLALAGLILVLSPYSLLPSSHLGKQSEKPPGKTTGKMSKKFNLMRIRGGGRGEGMNISLLSEGKKKSRSIGLLGHHVMTKIFASKSWTVTVVQRHWPCLALHWFTSLSTDISFPVTETAIPG